MILKIRAGVTYLRGWYHKTSRARGRGCEASCPVNRTISRGWSRKPTSEGSSRSLEVTPCLGNIGGTLSYLGNGGRTRCTLAPTSYAKSPTLKRGMGEGFEWRARHIYYVRLPPIRGNYLAARTRATDTAAVNFGQFPLATYSSGHLASERLAIYSMLQRAPLLQYFGLL